jgi:hypothetical protein
MHAQLILNGRLNFFAGNRRTKAHRRHELIYQLIPISLSEAYLSPRLNSRGCEATWLLFIGAILPWPIGLGSSGAINKVKICVRRGLQPPFSHQACFDEPSKWRWVKKLKKAGWSHPCILCL